ncbi:MAG: hypothetical protein JWN60_744 [Acidobacteria bacterium]|nr:hypothetical protein [Acidobacteriota bacterium]
MEEFRESEKIAGYSMFLIKGGAYRKKAVIDFTESRTILITKLCSKKLELSPAGAMRPA